MKQKYIIILGLFSYLFIHINPSIIIVNNILY